MIKSVSGKFSLQEESLKKVIKHESNRNLTEENRKEFDFPRAEKDDRPYRCNKNQVDKTGNQAESRS